MGRVEGSSIDEASGLAISLYHPDVAYVHNDKGDSSRFFAVHIQSGKVVVNAKNYDWEDMTYGPCVDDCAVTSCSWPEGDAETLMISPDGKLFVISKADGGQGVMAELPNSAWDQARVTLNMTQTAKLQLSTNKHDPRAGEISPDGKAILLIADEGAYYLSVPNGDYLGAVNSSVPQKIQSYVPETKTEGVAWRPDGAGFCVIAEGHHPTIYFYPKLSDAIIG